MSNEIILGLVALVLVVFSLVASIGIPRRYEDFPGRRLPLFALVAVLLVVSMLAAVEVFGEAHEGGETAAERQENVGPGTTGEATTTAPGQGGGQGGGGQEGAAAGDPEAGKAVFDEQGCGACHAFEAAGSTGTTGPDLDESLQGKDTAYVRESIVQPDAKIAEGFAPGVMPEDYGEKLSDEQIAGLVAFLTEKG